MVAGTGGGKGRLILASASPRRLSLLRQIGIEPDEVAPAELDEIPNRRELPAAFAKRMAEEKAAYAGHSHQGNFVLAADTVVALGRRIMGKAKSEAEAAAFLRALSGRRHRVLGAVKVIAPGGREAARLVTTMVTFKRLTEPEIQAYIKSGEWRDKAGAYAIQGHAAAFVPAINGSYTNVVGLPLVETRNLLVGQGYRPHV
ncbi:MAG: Maf family nucleotide pyrophosphatase [Pseudomonadota bacterium]